MKHIIDIGQYHWKDLSLFYGDCIEVMDTLIAEGYKTDMILCDLPYGTTACKWDTVIPFAELWERYKKIIKPKGAIVLFASQPFTSNLIMSNPKMFRYCWVWNKRFAANFSLAKYQPQKIHEDICVFSIESHNYFPQVVKREKPITIGKNRSKSGAANLAHAKPEYNKKVYDTKQPESILFCNTRAEGKKLVDTQKPVELCEYLIKTYTKEGETVLDNCFGSGTTGIAVYNTKRKCIAIEKELKHYEISKNRFYEHTQIS
jgi:site-specific DNA-methyltransferase (adenine-specific)